MGKIKVVVIGESGGTPLAGGATSCYLVEADGYPVLLDIGSGALSLLQKIRSFDSIDDIIISHFHSDHVGSLGSLIFYLRFKKIKEVNVIFPIKTLPYMLLQIYGIDESLFKVKLPEEVDGYYIKEYEQLHGDVDVDGNIVSMPSYGYHVVNDNDNFFYSGDTCIISDIILEKFKSKEIKIMYHEVTTDGYKSHMQLENLVKIIPFEDRQRVVCMHMGDGVDVSEMEKFGLESVR